MTIEVYNRYWEYTETYYDITNIEENDRTFILYKCGGWKKEFTNTIYSYYEK